MPHQGSTEEGREGGDRLDVAQDRPAGHVASPHRLVDLPPVPLRRRGGPTRAHSWLVDRPAHYRVPPVRAHGLALWMLTAGLRGVVATLSWVAAVVFALFYDAGDAIAGISTGILARSAEVGALRERAAVEAIETLYADTTKNLLFDIGRN